MRYFTLIVLTALLMACNGGLRAEGPGETKPLAVEAMTFNIRYGSAKDGENAWPLRRSCAASCRTRMLRCSVKRDQP